MKSILIIAPYKNMYDDSIELSKEYDFVDVDFGTLEDAVNIVRNKVNNGIEVVISRGGTLSRIRESFPGLSTVEIKVSPYDMVSAIDKAKKYGKNICVIGFKNIIDGVENLGSILGVNIITYLVKNKIEAEQAFKDAISKYQIDAVLGGSLAESMSKDLSLQTVYLKTSKNSIIESILDAKNILDIKLKDKIRTERIEAILNNMNEGVIATDNTGKIILYNKSAEKMIGINNEDIISNHTIPFFKKLNLEMYNDDINMNFNKLVNYGNKSLLVHNVPILIKNQYSGSVATFEDVTKIQEYEEMIRSNLIKKGNIARYTFSDIIGNSPQINKSKEKAYKYAINDSNILIIGDTGTGKEIFAQSIHNSSLRKNGPFVAINCPAIPPSLMESELFGYEKGTFTGANREGKRGLFTLAHTGTVFLDEISETSMDMQLRLLRVIQEREVRPIGSDKVIPIDVRIISATNKSLLDEVKKGKFRRDLYYRLNVLNLNIPTLFERKDDIELLCNYFIRKQKSKSSKYIKLSSKALQFLETYHWPGNIRELENVIQRLCILYDGNDVDADGVVEILDEYVEPNYDENPLKLNEKIFINQVVKECNGNKTEAAKKLGISRTQLWRKLNG